MSTKGAIEITNSLVQYTRRQQVATGVILYFVVSIGLKALFDVDILLPCLWKTLFHVECPGCGMTTALIQLVCLDFFAAYRSNPLVFIVIPSALGFALVDFVRFHRVRLWSASL
jgi:hypothetical protein